MSTKTMNYSKNRYNYKKVRKEKSKETSLIPKFGFKSAIIIALTALLSGIFIPFALSSIGLDVRVVAVIANAIMIPAAVCISQYYIETSRGFKSSIKKVYIGLMLTIGIITYFWQFVGLYM